MSTFRYDEEEAAEALEIPGLYNDDYDDEALEDSVAPVGVDKLDQNVRNFIVQFRQSINDKNVVDIQTAYESTFNKLTERFFDKTAWPSADVVSPLVDGDTVFLILYKELYYRHLYYKLKPTLEQRAESFDNYCELFAHILNSATPVSLELPTQWLWDIVDEFIYQFQTFYQFRANLADRTDAEIATLTASPNMWSVHIVLNVLHSLIEKSRIQEQLIATRNGTDVAEAAGEFGNGQLYKMLGFFSIVGLLRLHCQLGDYHLALKMVENIELTKKSALMRVTACYVSAYYHVSFAYVMMRRYRDAIGTLSHILLFISRTKQFHTRSYQYNSFIKQNEQMYSLLAICVSLSPQKVDDVAESTLREKHGEKLDKVLQGNDESIFEDWFSHAAPKFISPSPPNYDVTPRKNAMTEPVQHQRRVFLREVRQQLLIPKIRSFLRLYTTMPVAKLASLLELDQAELVAALLRYKHKTRTLNWTRGSVLEGQYSTPSDLTFYLAEDMIHIAESKPARRYADAFVRQINRFEDLIISLETTPAVPATTAATAVAAK